MPGSVEPLDAAFVRELVYKRAAIVLDESKTYLIENRLESLARELGVASIAEVVASARKGAPGMETRIVEAITTHETSFFRDLHPFEALKRQVLPALVEKRRATKELTIWSAACSSGQEPYSIAMLLLDHFPEAAKWPAKVIATDLSEQVLARAREGRFKQLEVNRGLPAPLLVKHFEKSGTEWLLKKAVKDLVEFRQLNLLGGWTLYPKPDVVFMRNVLIYFDTPTKQQILKRLRTFIPTDGVLFLGAAETTLGVDDAWERVGNGPSTYYRVRP